MHEQVNAECRLLLQHFLLWCNTDLKHTGPVLAATWFISHSIALAISVAVKWQKQYKQYFFFHLFSSFLTLLLLYVLIEMSLCHCLQDLYLHSITSKCHRPAMKYKCCWIQGFIGKTSTHRFQTSIC